MNYIHYVKDKLSYPFQDICPDDDKASKVIGKPSGLWFSVGTAWIDWCLDNWEDWRAKSSVKLNLSACHLKVVTTDKSKAFEEEYGVQSIPGSLRYSMLCRPDWNRLKQEGFDGIIVPDYRRTWDWDEAEGTWWYAWDCPSGCVWNASKVKVI